MPNLKNRPRPRAHRDTNPGGHPERTIILTTGRGDVKLTPHEARELAVELARAAGDLSPAPMESRPCPTSPRTSADSAAPAAATSAS